MNDEDAKEQARQQKVNPAEIETLTVERWFPVLGDGKWRPLRGKTGTIVVVHLDKDQSPAYTIDFDGSLVEVPFLFFKVLPEGT